MSESRSQDASREERVNQIIAEYLEAEQTGRTVDRKTLLDKHPDLADELNAFFADHERIRQLAKPFKPDPGTDDRTTREEPTLPPIQQGKIPNEATLPPTQVAYAAKSAGKETLPLGTRVRYFGDYELLEEIARGGMGVVYKARQINLNRIVALKMILAGQLAGEDDVKRFYTEAEAAANLDHPGIVPIFEVGQHEGQHYFSMGFVEGESLADRLKDGPLPPREAAECTRKVAEAIAFAHERGVIHRDLKPANVLLARSDRIHAVHSHDRPDESGHYKQPGESGHYKPKITDFGLAKKTESDSNLTGTGQILGTPSYMPPEQASGKVDEVTETADIYGLGAILYASVTGRPPFQAANPLDTLMQVLEQEPVSPRTLNSKVPQDLETICLKCLEKDRYRRYTSAQELADELQRFINGEPILARPIGTTARAWRWCKRKPVVAGLIAAVAVSLLLGFAVSAHFAVEATRRAAEAVENANQANEERIRANQERDRASAQLYVADLQLAHRAWQERRTLRMQSLLEAHQPRPGQLDLRDWEWFYLRGLCFGERSTFRGHTSYVGYVAWSPDGRRLASASKDGTVKIWDADRGGAALTMARGWNEECTLAWSADGTHLLASPAVQLYGKHGRDSNLRVLAWETESGRTLLNAAARMGAWDPDGKRIAYVGPDGKLRIWNVSSHKTEEISPGVGPLRCLAWSPDGTRCAVGGQSGTVVCLDAGTSKTEFKLECNSSPVTTILWSPRGKQIVTNSGYRMTTVWNTSNGRLQFTLPKSFNGHEQLSWSPDSRWLVTVESGIRQDGCRGSIRVWNGADGREIRSLPGTMAAWSPDGASLATAFGPCSVAVWQAETWHRTHIFDGHTAEVLWLAWRPDGQQLASGASDLTVKTWALVEGPQVSAVPGVRSVVWSPDGKFLAAQQPDKAVRVFESSTGAERAKLQARAAPPTALAWSPRGRYLAAASYDSRKKTGDVGLYDARSGKCVRTFPALNGSSGMVWSPDGNQLAVCGPTYREQRVQIVRVEDGTARFSVPGWVIAWSRDGRRLVTAGGGFRKRSELANLRVWDAETGAPLRSLSGHAQSPKALAFSPDNRRLASAAFDAKMKVGEIILWNLETGDLVHQLRGHDAPIVALAWSPNGNRLASIGGKQLILWDTSLEQEVLAIDVDPKTVTSVAWCPDGRRLATAGSDPTIRIWDATAGYQHATPLSPDYFQTVRRLRGFF